MGTTNLKKALEFKYASFAGELKDKAGEVARIQTLFEQLPALSARAQRLERLVECAEEILKELDPTWTPARVKPRRPHVPKSPVKLGRITKSVLDVLRESRVPLTTKEIADRVLEREPVEAMDQQEFQRLKNSVDATLRAKEGTVVKHDRGWPRAWSIIC